MSLKTAVSAALITLVSQSAAVADAITIGTIRVDFSDPAQRPTTSAEKHFAEAYLAAARKRDIAAMRALVHPASLACASSDANREHLDTVLSRPFRHDIPADARLAFANVPDAEQHVPTNGLLTLPAVPKRIFVLDYKWLQKDDDGKVTRSVGMTVVRLLAPDADTLKLAEYCLTPDGEAKYRANRPR
ncbi:MAG TPA: hypothetical protein PK970_01560 [Hyphomicrobiaceae bacterium]|nr:hypothetical protein [Hyphomicrobiaceae bacterium]